MVPGKDFAPCMQGTVALEPQGQVTAVSFASPYVLAVQEREPAAISFYDLRTQAMRSRVEPRLSARFRQVSTFLKTRQRA